MGILLVALVLPLVAGARAWPWWIVLVNSILAFIGFFTANLRRIEIVEGGGGVPRLVVSALAMNTVIGAVLFGIGHLLRHL